MSEENTFAVSEETAAAMDSTDLTTRPPNPLYVGTVPAIVKSIREHKEKDKVTGEPTGRVSFIVSCAIGGPVKEWLPDGEVGDPREFNAGHRIEAWIDVLNAPEPNEEKREFKERLASQARSEFGVATRVVKFGQQFKPALFKEALEKPVVLKLSVRQGKQGGYFQDVRFKAPATNGKA